MLVKSIFIELRSRLRSCNVFITTGVDFNLNCNLRVSIQANCIVLNYYNDEYDLKRRDSLSSIESLSDSYSEDDSEITSVIPIQEFCKIIPNSMSCLKIIKNTISFRVLTEPKNGGNFYTELLSAQPLESNVKKNPLIINVGVDSEFKITCANCSNVISDGVVKFGRILELPSANLDMSEWFCHGHCHGTSSEADEIKLQPNKNDFLYRLTYFVINKSLLSDRTNKFNAKRDAYHCNRCLAWLGLKDKETVKIFNSEVKVCENDAEKRIFSHKTSIENIHTDDFIYTIENVTREFNLGFQYAVMCKIVLECTVSSTNKQYLLIWVMDKELQVLKNNEQVVDDRVQLQSSFVTKILYKIELLLNDEVESWLSDPAVATTEISKSMFFHGVEHLQKMSMKVPETFRNANGYFVSYLKV